MSYSIENKVSPSSPAFLGLWRNAQVSDSQEGPLTILSKEGSNTLLSPWGLLAGTVVFHF